MANRKMVLTDSGVARYRTRMMQAGDAVPMDGPSSRLWERMGWATKYTRKAAKKAEPVEQDEDELTKLRAEYKERVGKQPYHGWDAETIRLKMSEAEND